MDSGGIGMTSGLVDAGGLADCLIGIHEGRADIAILDEYDAIRRAKYHDLVDPLSSSALRRMWSSDPDQLLADDPFMRKVVETAADKDLLMVMELVSSHPCFQSSREIQKRPGQG